MNGYGGLVLLFLGIGLIFIATTAKGKEMIRVLFTKQDTAAPSDTGTPKKSETWQQGDDKTWIMT